MYKLHIRLFYGMLGCTVFLMAAMQLIGNHLVTASAPLGIISFEFAGTLEHAREILISWGEQGCVYAALSLGLDYLFLLAYSTTLALACGFVGRRLSPRFPCLSQAGILIAWAQFVAALFDAVENYALIQLLLGSRSEACASIAWWCAGPKFMIVSVGILYVIGGAGMRFLSR